MVQTVSSYDSNLPGTGSVLNQCYLTYNNFGQLVEEQQDHSGSVASWSCRAWPAPAGRRVKMGFT
jgi:hypothetical protein